jgi:hypothetical protein
MKHSGQTLVQLHAFLMDLCPRTYRVEYGDEQRIVFCLMTREAARSAVAISPYLCSTARACTPRSAR